MKDIIKILKGILVIVVLTLLATLVNEKSTFGARDIIQANLSKGLRTVKITEEKIKIDDEESIVESVSISPISIELNLNGKNPNNGYVDFKVFDKSGSEIFLSGGSNMSSKTKATYVWTFMEPVDINAINKIVIEGNEIILKN